MNEGDLLLVDAAANYRGQTGDITRTYPVSGRFTPEQREIYALVLAAQDAGMKPRIGALSLDIERASEAVIKERLLRLGLITDATGLQFRTWYYARHPALDWHGHARRRRLQAAARGRDGVRDRTWDLYPPRSARAAGRHARKPRLPERVGPALKKYAGIGVRIEDSFLLTGKELVRLSARVPRTLQEIDDFMRSRK